MIYNRHHPEGNSVDPDANSVEMDYVPGKEQLRAALDTVVYRSLSFLTPILSLLLGIYTLFYLLAYPPDVGRVVALSSLGLAAFCLILSFSLRRKWLLPQWSHALAALIVTLMLVIGWWQAVLEQRPETGMNLLLLTVAIGFLFVSTRWMVVLNLITVAGWFLLMRRFPDANWTPLMFALGIALSLSALIHLIRMRTLRRAVLLALQNAHQRQVLAQAYAAVQQQLAQREEMDRALQESEATYRALFENTLAVKLLVDPETGRLIDVNQAACSFYGYTRADLLQKRIMDINMLTPGEVRQEMARAEAEGRAYFHFVHQLASGEARDVEVYSSPVKIKDRMLLFSIVHDITDRVQAEAQVRYQAVVLQNVSDAVISTDLNYVVQSWNRAAHDIYGWSAKEAIGQPLAELLKTEHIGTTRELAREQFEREGYWQGEVIQRRRDGSRVDIHAMVRLIRDNAGNLIASVAANRDVSIQKKTERLLQTRLKMQLFIARISTEFINCATTEIDARIEQALAETCRFAGVDHVYLYLLNGNKPHVFSLSYRWPAKTTASSPLRQQAKNGDRRLQFSSAGHITLPNVNVLPQEAAVEQQMLVETGSKSAVAFSLMTKGVVLGYLCLASHTRENAWDQEVYDLFRLIADILMNALSRKWSDDALRESNTRYQMLVEQSLQGLIVFQDDRPVFVNRAAANSLGYRVDEMLAFSAQETIDILVPHYHSLVNDRAQERLAGRPVSPHYEIEALKKDGTPIWLEISSNQIEYQGRPALQVVLMDITERKRTEEALRQSQKLESLGVLAGGIAHDFNNLLVAMLGQTALAQARLPEGSPALPHIKKAVSAAERAADLTRQLLAYSGQGKFQVMPVDLNVLIQENLRLLAVAVPRLVQMRPQLTQPLPLIQADTGQMQQVVMNLIINAAEAIGNRPGFVDVATGVQTLTPDQVEVWQYTGAPLTSGKYVYLRVTDNGGGMEAETISRIFDPFFTTKFTGRGLGLAAVLGIVRGHHGGLQVESEPGQGTTFHVYFPVAKEAMN